MQLPSIGGIANLLGAWKIKLVIAGLAVLVLIVAVIGIYNVGLVKGKAQSQVAIANYEKQVVQLNNNLQAKNTTTTEQVRTEIETKTQYRDKILYKTRDVIKLVPSQCKLSQGWVYVHNSAASGTEADPKLAAVTAASTITDQAALNIITSNYDAANRAADMVDQWQKWYTGIQNNAKNTTTSK